MPLRRLFITDNEIRKQILRIASEQADFFFPEYNNGGGCLVWVPNQVPNGYDRKAYVAKVVQLVTESVFRNAK